MTVSFIQYSLFNGHLMPLEAIPISPLDRAFSYSDGLFETMIWTGTYIRLLKGHLERAKQGASLLDLAPTLDFTEQSWNKMAAWLVNANGIEGQARIKCFIWRKEGGLYAPTLSDANYCFMAFPWSPSPAKKIRMGIAQHVTLQANTPLSSFKKIAALPYIVAGIEGKKRGFDEMLLLNNEGKVAEAVSSNVFWTKERKLYTPALNTGCLPGMMRQYFIRSFMAKGMPVLEVEVHAAELIQAESVFLTNAAGIAHVLSIEENSFQCFQMAEEVSYDINE